MISGVRASSIRIEVDFVDDRENVPALDHVLHAVLHVVAQVVEAKLVVGAVGNIAVVSDLALLVVEPVHDDAGLEPEEAVDLAHPLGVALGEIIVDGDDMNTTASQRVEIDRQSRDQRLAFAGLHLGDLALVQDHAADQLHVEVPLPDGALGRLAHGRERRHQDVVERLAFGELLLEGNGARAKLLVGERQQFRLERIDCVDPRLILAHAPVIGGAEEFSGDSAKHCGSIPCLWQAAGAAIFKGNAALLGHLQWDSEHRAGPRGIGEIGGGLSLVN